MDTYVQIRQLMAEIFQISESDISRDTKQGDFASWDSVGHLNLMLAIEQEFGVTLEVEDLRTLTSIDMIVNYLETTENVI